MSYSIYKNSVTLAKEAREARERKLQEEVERREKMRQSVGQNSARSIRAQEVREIEQAREAYQQEFRQYYQQMRDRILISPDPDGYFEVGPALECDPAVARDVHWDLLLKDNPDFYNSEVNRDAFSQYFTVNNCARYDLRVLSAAYKRLLSLGLLETAESQQPAVTSNEEPQVVQPQLPAEPIRLDEDGPVYSVHTYNFESKFAKRDDRIEGRNPENGFAWICTKTEIERMSADNFKRFASITKATQSLTGMRSDYGIKYRA